MNNSFAILQIIFLLGSIQGVILSLYLFFQKEKPRIRRITLGFLVLILSYDLFETALNIIGWFPTFFQFLVLIFNFGIGSSIYLYVSYSLKPGEKLAKPVWFYYLPLIIQIFLRLIIFFVYLQNQKLSSVLYSYHLLVSMPATVILFWIFLIWSWKRLKNSVNENDLTKDEQTVVFKWIKLFLIVVTFIAFIWTIVMFWAAFGGDSFQFYYYLPFEIIMVGFVYWISIRSFQRTKFVYLTAKKNSQALFESIPDDEVSKHLKTLQKAMETDKLYLNPDLNLLFLSEATELKPKIISSVLNQKLGKGFNEFVNEYRVEEAKSRLLENPENLNITEIAFVSGFNSLPTFQRAFKSQTSVSPKEFIALHKKSK